MTQSPLPGPLTPEQLCPSCERQLPDFETTSSLVPLAGLMGQERALDAIRMAAQIRHHDFNLFVLGTTGSGRRTATRALLRAAAKARPVPQDWVYVNNFDAPHRPIAIALDPGQGPRLRDAMQSLVDDLANDIPALFESDDYQTRRRVLEQGFSERNEEAMDALVDRARERKLVILRTPMGLAVAPTRDDEVLKPDEYKALPEEERAQIDAAMAQMQQELEEVLKNVPGQQKEHRQKVEELNFSMASEGIDAQIEAAFAAFADIAPVQEYKAAVRQDLIRNIGLFLMRAEDAQGEDDDTPRPRGGTFPVATTKRYAEPRFQRYGVNVIVSHPNGKDDGAPVAEPELPSLANLIGRVEHVSQMGALVTNFTMIRPGALHQANGGYLMLDARDLLTEPLAWDALKRALRAREISIVSASERLSLFSTISLEPDPIPLDIRVVLIGERHLYYLLSALDPEFSSLFKLEADFDDRIERRSDTVADYTALAANVILREGLRPLARAGMARVLVESTRLADDAERLSLNIDHLSDILREADHWASDDGAEVIGEAHVNRAIHEAERRAGRVRELSLESITRETVLIDTGGAQVGQINALSVLALGGYSFGKPSRVTARVRLGSGKVVDIERETDMGGPLHSKGVMILQGWLAAHYAPGAPLSLWASIVFEQSYGGVDGDSASAAELIALVSALSGVPLKQSLAITGAVNQLGQVQAIGGVNHKIEGFFDVCAARGLTGSQGVLIPQANVKHLALRSRVVQAVRGGQFAIWPVETVDQALALMTGQPAGVRGADGRFDADSVHDLAEARLLEFARARAAFGAASGGARGTGADEGEGGA